MRVLVTGSSGYLGIPLVRKLLSVGHKVVGVDRGLFGTDDFRHQNLALLNLDIRVSDILEDLIQDTDALIHLADVNTTTKKEPFDSHVHTETVNFDASVSIMQMLKYSGKSCRFIYVSDSRVYGGQGNYDNDKSEFLGKLDNRVSILWKSKFTKEFIESQGAMNAICLVLPTLYGWSPRMRFDTLVNQQVASSYYSKIAVESNDSTSILHVMDAVSAIKCALDNPQTNDGGVLDVVGEDISIGELLRCLENHVKLQKRLPGDSTDFCKLDGSDFNKLFNFSPTWSLRDGVNEMMMNLSKIQGLQWTDPIFHNHKVYGHGQ